MIWVDVTDFVRWRGPVVGIQRVVEGLSHALLAQYSEKVRLCFYDTKLQHFVAVPKIVFRYRLGRRFFPLLCPLLYRCIPAVFKPKDILLLLGPIWDIPNFPSVLKRIKEQEKLSIVFLVHDIIAIKFPEFFRPEFSPVFRKSIVDMLGCADMILSDSRHTANDLDSFCMEQNLPRHKIQVIRLADKIQSAPSAEALAKVDGMTDNRFVLCVGTIEKRKNPKILCNVWQRLIKQYGIENVPTLVFVGRLGYEAGILPSEKIVLLQGIKDAVLASLYQQALFTVYPSFYEGWGLPIAESLNYGKYAIVSNTSSMPEVGGDLVDYADPFDEQAWYTAIERAIFEVGYVKNREVRILREFKPTSWADTARQIVEAIELL